MCTPNQPTLCNNSDCDICLNNSFASIQNSTYWEQNMNQNITQRNVFKNSQNKYWFKCNVALHPPFHSTLFAINRGRSCPHC